MVVRNLHRCKIRPLMRIVRGKCALDAQNSGFLRNVMWEPKSSPTASPTAGYSPAHASISPGMPSAANPTANRQSHPPRATPRGHRTLIIHTARQETTQLPTKRHPVTTHTMPKTPASWPNTCPSVGFRLWEPSLQALAGNGMTALALRRQALGGPGLLAFRGPPRRVPSRRTPPACLGWGSCRWCRRVARWRSGVAPP